MAYRPNPVDVRYAGSSPGGFWRPVQRPPQSPCPQVPDITEFNTGLEWFDMSTLPGTARLDQAVPSPPCLNAQSSPRCNFSVPSTPVQETWKLLLNQGDERSPDYNKTWSPLVQTVPVIGYLVKSGPKSSPTDPAPTERRDGIE